MLKLADEYSEAINLLKQKSKEKSKLNRAIKNNDQSLQRK